MHVRRQIGRVILGRPEIHEKSRSYPRARGETVPTVGETGEISDYFSSSVWVGVGLEDPPKTLSAPVLRWVFGSTVSGITIAFLKAFLL